MARPFWQKILQAAEYSPFLNPGGANLGYNAYERERLENMRTPYQIATDPRMMTGTGPGLAQIEHPQYSGAIPRGNIGQGSRGVPRPENFRNPLAARDPTEDQYRQRLRVMFLNQLGMGAAGGEPAPTYAIQVGPAARAFAPLNMYGRMT